MSATAVSGPSAATPSLMDRFPKPFWQPTHVRTARMVLPTAVLFAVSFLADGLGGGRTETLIFRAMSAFCVLAVGALWALSPPGAGGPAMAGFVASCSSLVAIRAVQPGWLASATAIAMAAYFAVKVSWPYEGQRPLSIPGARAVLISPTLALLTLTVLTTATTAAAARCPRNPPQPDAIIAARWTHWTETWKHDHDRMLRQRERQQDGGVTDVSAPSAAARRDASDS